MNLNRHNPLNDMPLLGEKKAPKKFRGKYSEVAKFIRHYNRLLEQHQVETDADRCEGILEYCSRTVQEFIESSPHYLQPNWERLEADILKYYDAEKEEMKYNITDFLRYLTESGARRMPNLERWKAYYREYMSLAGHLRATNQLSERDYLGYFWIGIPVGLQSLIEERLQARYPDFDTRDPWPIEHVTAVAELHFKRGKYSDRLLQLPTKLRESNDSDYPDSDDEESSSDSDSDSDYDRRRHRSRSARKKRRTKKAHTPRKPVTKQLQEDRTRIIKAPQEDVEGIISKLNSMSLEDPTYGALYYKAVSSDPSGMVARCIRRSPIQEESTPSSTTYAATVPQPVMQPPSVSYPAPMPYAPHPSSYPYPSPNNYAPRPPPVTYPNNIPVGNQVPPNMAARGGNVCFGCGDLHHMMRECPGMVDLLNKGILQMDLFQRYQFRDGRALRRLPNETFLNCVARMGYNNGPPNSGQPTSVNFVTVERGNGVFVRDDPPADVEWPDTDSDDDGPYVQYGQTVALSGRYPTFTETQDQSSDTSDDEEMEFEVYPVERSETTI